LAAGLIWSLATSDGALASPLQQFFLGCVIIAGIFGGITVKGTIVVVQAVPALLALVLSFAGRG
jgi:putative membrane protein